MNNSAITTIVNVNALALIVATLVQLTKFLIDKVVPPTDSSSNQWKRLYVYLVAALVVAFVTLTSAFYHTGADAQAAVFLVFGVGSTAIVEWHVMNSDAFPPIPGQSNTQPPAPSVRPPTDSTPTQNTAPTTVAGGGKSL